MKPTLLKIVLNKVFLVVNERFLVMPITIVFIPNTLYKALYTRCLVDV